MKATAFSISYRYPSLRITFPWRGRIQMFVFQIHYFDMSKRQWEEIVSK